MARPPIDPRLWRYARSARGYLALSVALSLIVTATIVVAALLIGRVLAGVVTDPGSRTLGAWTVELVVLALVIAGRVLATWSQARLAHRAGASVVAELEGAVLAAGARLSPRELDTRRTELAVVVGTGLAGLRGYLVGYVPALLLAVLVPPIVLAVIAAHDPASGVIAVVTLPLIPIFMILIGLLTQGRSEATLAATTRLSDQLLDLFAGMPTLRALGRETGHPESGPDAATHTMRHRVRDLGDALRQRTMRALRMAFLSSMVLEMLATLSVALIAVSIGLRLVFGEMSLYAGLVVLVLAPEVYLPLRMVGERFHAAQDGMAAADKAFAILESTPTAHVDGGHVTAPALGGELVASVPGHGVQRLSATDPGDELARWLPGHGVVGAVAEPAGGDASNDRRTVRKPAMATALDRDSSAGPGTVELRDLSVRARDGYAPAGLSAVLRPSCLTVLAGPNGSGKSTVVQAILGLIAPDRGVVTVDGVDIRELDPDRWWARVAWLPQRPVLIPGTLRDNLELLGARTVDRAARGPARVIDDLEAACLATGFDAVLADLPDGWNTVVGPGGVGLSLGQRQRLTLTRVLATDRPVLLLDEPTAHLDAAAEATVLAALQVRARAGATVVVIGHRPTVLAAADHVVQVRADRAEVLR
ncbi:ABC transporter ATP-binding protein/permease [Nocardia gamkensis]|uniref:ATP-binding cassette domain-containing protein n=1 Tax=Nocardia gamkensis TaxID=352869 RepID=A0A7X6L7A6_9NOCA|nr:ATP-binding cassette domain-containing protein [Nocardia gamkensis]NKY28937.1 ATP-binding cassette domain-containing protein [Nocardia gamkensis]NQE66357.1 ATP-binding/permease protein CydD [Nocardia gamkensis]